MKRGCSCLVCYLGLYKDMRILLRRACGTTLDVINEANATPSVPLIMLRAAHERDPVGWLRERYPTILDICYDLWNKSLALWLISERFYRDQVTFHHAVFHRAKEYADLLVKNGCSTVIIRDEPPYFGVCLSNRLVPWTVVNSMYDGLCLSTPDKLPFSNESCAFDIAGRLVNVTTIDKIPFVSWRTAVNKPNDMEPIYKMEREWPDILRRRQWSVDPFGYGVASSLYGFMTPFLGPPPSNVHYFDPGPVEPIAQIPPQRGEKISKSQKKKLHRTKQNKAQLRDRRAEQRFQKNKRK